MSQLSSWLIGLLDRPGRRQILQRLITYGYHRKGLTPDKVLYHDNFKVWEYRFGDTSILSHGAGWVATYEYLHSELGKYSCAVYYPKDGDVVIDIGCGIGEESVVFSKLVGLQGKVFAIEANPRTFEVIRYLKGVNRMDNTVIENIAIADKAGTIQIEDTVDSISSSVMVQRSSETFEVRAETLDEFVVRHQIKKISMLKANIEGAEQLMVNGMEMSQSIVQRVAISCHDFRHRRGESEFFKTRAIVETFLRDYQFEIIQHNGVNEVANDYVHAINHAAFR